MQTSVKKTEPLKRPQRYFGEQQCDRRLLQMLPVELDARGRRRVSPWTKTKEVEKKGEAKKIYKVVASAIEEIRLDDLLTLIAVTGCMQDAISNKRAAFNTIAEAGQKELTLISAVFRSSHLCLDAAGDNNITSFIATLERLMSYQCTYYSVGGSQGVAKYLYKYHYDAECSEISVILDASVVNYYAKFGWVLNINTIRKDLPCSPARALVLYLSQQPGNRFNTIALCKKISLNYGTDKENRRALKQALELLKPQKPSLDSAEEKTGQEIEDSGYKGFITDYKFVKDMVEINR